MHSGRRFRFLGSVIIACAATMTASQAAAQRAPDYPERPAAAPEQVARGQQLFKSNCSFCHGSDGRGGETGPNQVRSRLSAPAIRAMAEAAIALEELLAT